MTGCSSNTRCRVRGTWCNCRCSCRCKPRGSKLGQVGHTRVSAGIRFDYIVGSVWSRDGGNAGAAAVSTGGEPVGRKTAANVYIYIYIRHVRAEEQREDAYRIRCQGLLRETASRHDRFDDNDFQNSFFPPRCRRQNERYARARTFPLDDGDRVETAARDRRRDF